MQNYIIRRLLQGILTFFGVSILVFVMGRVTGDPIRLMVPETATAEMREQVRRELGLDKPLTVQYLDFLRDLSRGDLGKSYLQNIDVSVLVLERMPATLQLAFASMAIAIIVSLPLGIFAALNRNTIWDLFGSSVALVGQATPNFWLGLLLILLFAVNLRWLPISGRETPQSIILPAITLSMGSIGYFTRLVRSSMLETLSADYIRTARGKGLSQRAVLLRHALPNALIPLVTMMGISFGTVLSGAFVVETIFAWPGLGRLGVNALFERDFAVIQGVVVISSGVFVITNLLVDILYSFIDPRIRLE